MTFDKKLISLTKLILEDDIIKDCILFMIDWLINE